MRKSRGKINKNGILEIERAGKFKEMSCRRGGAGPVTNNGDLVSFYCDDDCPLFREPQLEINYLDPETSEKMEANALTGRTWIALCGCETLWFDEFEDER